MDGSIQPLPGERLPPEPKRRESARRRGKDAEKGRAFEIPAEPPRGEGSTPSERPATPPAHADGLGLRIDVTA